MGRLDGRIAIVTGGGRGIGRSMALNMAKEGCRIGVTSRTIDELDSVVGEIEELGSDGFAVVADVMKLADIQAAVKTFKNHFGRIDILINNAGGGVPPQTPVGLLAATHEDQAFLDNISLNLVSAFRASREVLPGMIEQKHGRIINIGSGYAKTGGGGLAYTVAKHGLVGLTRAMATEVAQLGVTVNCLCPGWTNTQLVNWDYLGMQWGTDAKGAKARASADAIQNRVLEPDELGPMASLLASDDAKGITGQVISVDGGYRV